MSREAFEKWAQGKSLLINIREEMMYAAGYINVKEMAWEAWQAALQHPEQLPVAWLHIHKNGQGVSFTKADALGSVKSLPLYTYPQIAGKETKCDTQ
jgi:hypothetical protein